MTIMTCAAIGSALLDAGVGIRYCVRLFRREVHPRIATWVIFEIGVAMSLVTYFSSQAHSALKASLNLTDAAMVTVILATLLLSQRGRRIVFTRNEQLSLAIAGVALAAWWITKTAWVGFVGFQVVMSVAYVPTIEHLVRWRPGPAPEPVEMWGVTALAALLGMVADVTGVRHDYLAMLYPLRAFCFCVIVVGMILRWRRRGRLFSKYEGAR